MRSLDLVAIGAVPASLLSRVADGVHRAFRVRVAIRQASFELAAAFHPERQQYHSTELLRLLRSDTTDSLPVLGITPADLYIPILKYVFGEAELGGRAAVVGYHRLRDEFYGLPGNAEILAERTLKEAVHEFGHTLRLTHCDDFSCVMASAHSVEWVDLKTAAFCRGCARKLAVL